MNPFLYDIYRVLRNRGVILLIALTGLLALTALTIFNAFTSSQGLASVISPQRTVLLIMGLIYGFFVPVMGIQTGYSTYARDRATGVLDTVLVRPVTRTQIILSRYLAVLVASALGIGGALALLDVMDLVEVGAALPLGQLVGLYIGLVVEAVAFAGILFLIAHLVRSPGAIMGSAVVVFVLIDIVWFFLLLFVGVLLGGLTSAQGQAQVVALEYVDPAGYPFLMLAWVQGGLFGDVISPPAGGLASIGLTLGGLAVAGAFWSTVPFALSLWLARRRD